MHKCFPNKRKNLSQLQIALTHFEYSLQQRLQKNIKKLNYKYLKGLLEYNNQ